MLFIWQGSVLPDILPRLIFIFVVSVLVVRFHGQFFDVKISLNPAPFTLIGIALAIFLGFRNSAGYERFWEGRKLWGALLNDSRSLARQSLTISGLPKNSPEMREFLNLLIALPHALRHQLRKTDASPEMHRLLPKTLAEEVLRSHYGTTIILRELGAWVQKRRAEGKIDSMTLMAFDTLLIRLSDSFGGCERILSTPIPYAYTVLLHRTVYIYCFLLPFGLVDSIGWMTPLIAVFISYSFMALDAIVTEIEEPFGLQANDLPLSSICNTIEISVLEMAQETQLPQSVQPDNYLLN